MVKKIPKHVAITIKQDNN